MDNHLNKENCKNHKIIPWWKEYKQNNVHYVVNKHCLVGRQFSKGARFHHKCFERSLLLTAKQDMFLGSYSGDGKERRPEGKHEVSINEWVICFPWNANTLVEGLGKMLNEVTPTIDFITCVDLRSLNEITEGVCIIIIDLYIYLLKMRGLAVILEEKNFWTYMKGF